jgi:hypothetical protein
MQEDFERRQPPATIINTPEQIKARQALDEKLSAWPATNVPPAVISTNAPDRLRDALRKAMDELKP